MLNTRTNEVLAAKVERFVTAKERSRGLLKYDSAPQNFVAVFDLALWGFLPIIHTIGMRFPIDIVFCDRQQRVKKIFKDVKPGRLVVPWTLLLGGAPFLLEFSQCDLENLSVGDQLSWEGPRQ